MSFPLLPDYDTAVLGIIRDADHAPSYDKILRQSGLSPEKLDSIICRLTEQHVITTFPEDTVKKKEQRRYFSVMESMENIEKTVYTHLWELSSRGMLYFAYGSDMDPGEMYGRRCPGSIFLCRARLEGFSLTFDQYQEEWKGTVASIKLADGEGSVWGLIYCVKPEDWEKLDQYEEVPVRNRRVRVPVHTAYGLICADCYQSIPGDKRLPSRSYLDKIVNGANYFGLPQKYIRQVKSLPVSAE